MNGLIRTRPIGVGTPDCESLSSYIIRLAKANCVGPLILLSSIFDSLRIPHNRGTFGSNEMKSIDGPSGRSQFLAEAVAKATGCDEVRFLVLSRFNRILSPRNLLAENRRWVPSEIISRDESCPAFEKLVWRFRLYHFSPSGERLEDHCPSCRRPMGVLAANQAVGHCSYSSCRMILSKPRYPKTVPLGENDASHEFWVWAAEQLKELVSYCGELPAITFNEAFRGWLNYYSLRKHKDIADLLGVSHLSIEPWKTTRIPQLLNLLNICWCFRTSLLDFFRLKVLQMNGDHGPRESPVKEHERQKSHHRRPLDKVETEIKLVQILREDQYPHLSFAEICKKKFDRRPTVLRACFPELAKKISDRFRKRRAESAKVLRAGYLAQIREAARILREKGKPVTLKAIKGLLPVPAIMANQWAKTVARAEVQS